MQHTALSSAPLFVDDVMAESNRAVLSLRKNLAVQGDLILGQDQGLLLSAGTLTAGLSCICAAGGQGERQGRGGGQR